MQRRKCLKGATILLLLLVGAGVFISASTSKKTATRDSIRSQGPVPSSDKGLAENKLGRILSPSATGSLVRQLTSSQQITKAYGNLGLAFETNQGQADGQVKFLSRGQGYTLFLTSNEAVLRMPIADSRLPNDKPDRNNVCDHRDPLSPLVFLDYWQSVKEPHGQNRKSAIGIRKSGTVRMKVVGANTKAQIKGTEKLPGITNYFIGNDPKQWRTNIPNYARVQYEDVFPGIDLTYYGNQRQLEYDFVVAPGADFSQIQLAFEGAERIIRGKEGELLLDTQNSQLRMMAPHVYQIANGRRMELSGRYVFKDEKKVGFAVDGYNPSLALLIDPVFVYSMSFGGQSGDNAWDIQVDSSGSAYLFGTTSSLDFPTQNPFQSAAGGGTCSDLTNTFPCSDVFVTKINPDGNGFIYSTFLGGKGDDAGLSLALDSSGNAYLTGSTTSPDFPTKSAFFPTLRDGGEDCHRGSCSGDAFVTKLNASGNSLVYSTYLGGGSLDYGAGIAIDAARNVYVTGVTYSLTFPTTPGVFQSGHGGLESPDGFLTKLNAKGDALAYSTFLGPAGSLSATMPSSIFVDPPGNAYVTGKTTASDFPTTPGALQRQHDGAFDAFIMKLNVSGSALIYSTYLGGSNDDSGNALFVDSAGNAYVTGITSSKNFPVTPGSFQDHFDGFSGYVAKLTSDGRSLVYSTLGIGGADIAVDSQGYAYVAGGTFGGYGGKLSPSGSTLEGVLGGPGFGAILALSLDSSLNVYTAGSVRPVYPCGDQFTYCEGPSNVFVEKISPEMLEQSGKSSLFLPVILSLGGQNGSFYTSELSLANTGSQNVTLELNYTAAIGEGSGTASVGLQAGQQLIVPDAIDFLRSAGILIPTTGSHAGTLRVEYRTLLPEQISILARTATRNALGMAGLSYYALPSNLLLTDTCYLPGLRQNSIDRSNVAIQNAGKPDDGEVVLRVTIISGDPGDPYSIPLPHQHLAPGAFVQFNSILSSTGRSNANGYVRVDRISGSAPYYAYAVINDQVSSDGSFVPPVVSASLASGTTDSRVCDPGTRPCYLTLDFIVPAIVKTSEFTSELIVTNVGSTASTLCIDYVAEAISTPNQTAHFTLELGAQQQILIPDLIDYLRTRGVAGLESPSDYSGALFVKVVAEEVTQPRVFVSARTYSAVDNGRYGVFYTGKNPVQLSEALFPGLQQNAENRSNLAIINTGELDCQSDDVFKVEIFNGDSGELAGSIENIVLHPKEWKQFNRILEVYAPGVPQAYIRLIKTAGSNPFIAYAVLNDGAAPGQRTGDGAFIASSP